MPHLCKVDASGDGKKTPTRGVWEETGVTESKQRIDEPNKKLEEMKECQNPQRCVHFGNTNVRRLG